MAKTAEHGAEHGAEHEAVLEEYKLEARKLHDQRMKRLYDDVAFFKVDLINLQKLNIAQLLKWSSSPTIRIISWLPQSENNPKEGSGRSPPDNSERSSPQWLVAMIGHYFFDQELIDPVTEKI